MRVLWTALALAATAFGAEQPNARELVRQSIRNGEAAWEKSRAYSYLKKDVDKQFDSSGNVKSTDVDVYKVVPVHGDSFQLWVSHDGKPIPAEDARKQLEKLRSLKEDPELAAKRLEKERRERSFYNEIPDAFNFRITGQENLPTGPAWVLEATPRPGYQPKSRYAHMFPDMKGKLWIDEKDVQWVKADAVATDTVSFGYFIARLAKGSHIILEQTKLPDGEWVPKQIMAKASARTFVFFAHNFEETIVYGGYQRQGTGSSAARVAR